MGRMKTVLVCASLALTFAAGLATAQVLLPNRGPDPELLAAQDAVDEAIIHMQRVRNSNNSANMRTLAFLTLVREQIDALRKGTGEL
jgi:DNA-directed RNA polymerase specialized sigma24 family protein